MFMTSRLLLIAVSLVALTLLVYLPVRDYGFINYDDGPYVMQNRQVTGGLTRENILWAFRPESCEATSNWHPLTWLSLMADVSACGVSAPCMHRVNLALHTINVLLLFVLLVRMTDAMWPSAFVAAAFAIHPLHVESVAWISERKDVLSTMFVLLAMLAHLRYVTSQRVRWLAVALCAYTLSLLAKQMYVTLPLLLLLLDYWPLQRMAPDADRQGRRPTLRSLVVEKVPYLLLGIAFSAIAFAGQRRGGAVRSIEEYPILLRLLNAAVSYAAYVRKAIWPTDLAVFYPYPKDLPWLAASGSLVLLSLVTILVVRSRRRHPYLMCGWLWYLGTLVPVLGLIQIGRQSMADRYMYFPLIGLAIAVSWLAWTWAKEHRTRLGPLSVVAGLAVVGMAVGGRWQVSYWKDSETLFAHAAEVAESSLAYTKLGYEQAQRGESAAAANLLHRALKLDPEHVAALASLGNTYIVRGDIRLAARYLHKAVELDPDHAEAHYNLGIVYTWQKDFETAITHYREALRVDPDNAMIHTNLAVALQALGKTPDAQSHLQQAIAIEPDLPEAHFHLAQILAADSREREAIEHLQIVLRTRPDSPDVQQQLADLHERLQDHEKTRPADDLAD